MRLPKRENIVSTRSRQKSSCQMDPSRRPSRKPRCAKSLPGANIDFQFVDVKPQDRNQKRNTQKIVRANAAHFHWRHNRPPRDKVKPQEVSRSIISHDEDVRRPSLPMDSTRLGTDVDPFSSVLSNIPKAVVNHCIAFSRYYALVNTPANGPQMPNTFFLLCFRMILIVSGLYQTYCRWRPPTST